MAWFHPRTLLDKSYEIGIILKGIHGGLELLGAVLLTVIPPSAILSLTSFLTHNELAEDKHDFLASHVLRYGNELAHSSHLFLILYLATHGLVKVVLVIALLRQKHWAYPWAIAALILFLVYQVYLFVVHPTIFLGLLSVLDAVIIWLVWREWRVVRSGEHPRTKAKDKPSDEAPHA